VVVLFTDVTQASAFSSYQNPHPKSLSQRERDFVESPLFPPLLLLGEGAGLRLVEGMRALFKSIAVFVLRNISYLLIWFDSITRGSVAVRIPCEVTKYPTPRLNAKARTLDC